MLEEPLNERVQHKAQDDDQWLYLPARGRLKRIAKGGKKNYFMGTDFTYEDMEKEELDDYKYKLLEEEEIQGRLCYVVEAVPANERIKRDSGYSKRIMWITKDNFLSLKIEFYDRREKLIKTQTTSAWKNIQGTIWRPEKMLMDNHKAQHKTSVTVMRTDLNQNIADQTFTQRFILKDRHIR